MREEIFCPIRKRRVTATPEEQVRCQLLTKMVQELGYPLSLLSVERKIHEFLPQMAKTQIPNRRIDILCYSKNLEPLLLIECKASAFPKNAVPQLLGYNYFIRAPYIAIVSRDKTFIVSREGVVYDNFPQYEDLLYK